MEKREIEVAIGIGDLLQYSAFIIVNKLYNLTLLLNTRILNNYRNGSSDYKIFVEWLLNKLDIKFKWVDGGNPISLETLIGEYNINNFILSNKIFINKFSFDNSLISEYLQGKSLPEKYIVLHTKGREFYDYDGAKLFLEKFRSKIPIIIIGEREVSANLFETQVLNIKSLYKIFIETLPEHNTVIDLTANLDLDLQLNPTTDIFERDLSIINNAECNIVFGCGGNLAMSYCFSKKLIAYVGCANQYIYRCCPNCTFHKNFDDFKNNITELYNIS